MKKLLSLLPLCAVSAVLFLASGCVRHYDAKSVRGYRYVPNYPEVGSPAWVKWVDDRVDTRYANNRHADPATQEWYAVVDYYVFRSFDWDYYPTGAYRYHTYNGDSGDRKGFGNERFTADGERGYPDNRYRIGDERGGREGRDYRTYGTRSGSTFNGYASKGRWVEGSRSGSRTDRSERPGYHRGDYSSADTRDRYYGPARFNERDQQTNRNNRSRFKVGSIEWKHAVTEALLTGRVPKPPPRSDPWDQPLAPTH